MRKALVRMSAYELQLEDITEKAFDIYINSSISVYYNVNNNRYYGGYCGNDIFEIGSISDVNEFFLELGGDDNV